MLNLFSFHGLPAEVYQARILVAGVEIDPAQARFQIIGPNQFAFRSRAERKATQQITIPLR